MTLPLARLSAPFVPLLLLSLASCTESKPTASETPDVDGGAVPPANLDLSAFEKAMFDTGDVTEGVVVMLDGQVVFERYAAGYDASKRHITYSVSKSVGSALVGIAIEEGLLTLEDSVCKFVPAPASADPTYCETTIADTLWMTSGLAWDEGYADPATSNVLPMLYGDEADTGLYVAGLARAGKARETWHYSSGDSNLLARALRVALGDRDMRTWANEKLFTPAGLSSAVVEADASGTLLFSSGVFMTPRDMARFGQLYLDDGMSGTTRVLPSSWVTFTKTAAPAVATPKPHVSYELGERGGSYGASFWLNAATAEAPANTRLYASLPNDTFAAQGNWGQRVFILPSHRLVVARVGNDRVGFYDASPAVAAAVAAIDSMKVTQ